MFTKEFEQVETDFIIEQLQPFGYTDFVHTTDHGLVCIVPFIFTRAICTHVDSFGYRNRFCYHTLCDAQAALNDWMASENQLPDNWIRALLY